MGKPQNPGPEGLKRVISAIDSFILGADGIAVGVYSIIYFVAR